ncbi:hypothetical protein C8A05DRAFT_35360 [Staphylotrichum tortipilum]|uniref:OTU domain-containing protein n=1 Tax=Staphylotrichum tortipilum TaxID=2831512 RepID=A0AAN6RRR5_9PEZI|nr:hypothetical protein C8A05DRAFT_35360 [Staphylotrichum longicolle]
MEETLDQMQARHRKEQRELQGRITSKKKNASKKTRKFVNDECASLESQLRERQEEELRGLVGGQDEDAEEEVSQPQEEQPSSTDGITTTLAATSLSPSPSSQPAPQEQQPPAPAQKQKRNRQKERLARRAAEAEAASATAASEAASMPDRRATERASMLAGFAAHGLKEVEIAPDGHCLFSAVADQLGVHGIPISLPNSGEDGDGAKGKAADEGARGYKIVRGAAAGWIESHRGEYEGFLCGEEGGLKEYVRRIRETAEWGGEVELSALANAYGVEIRVVQGGGRVEVVKPTTEGREEGEGKTLWLAYYRHGYGLGEHYNSLRRAEV